MQYEKTVTLKPGTACLLRNAQPEDAAAMLQHLIQTTGETNYISRYPEEVTMTLEEEEAFLEKQCQSTQAILIVAFVGNRLAASAGLNPVGSLERFRHRATFGVSVKQEFWGMGIGAALLEACIEAARTAGYYQVELEVVAENKKAICLYEKYGFTFYGTRPNAFLLRDGSFHAEHLMVLQL